MMLKNPFKLLNGKYRRKKDESATGKSGKITKEEVPNEEDLDVATDALEDLFITNEMSIGIEGLDDDLRSQSSETSTVALLPSANFINPVEPEKTDEKCSER